MHFQRLRLVASWALLAGLLCGSTSAQAPRGAEPLSILDSNGREVGWYGGSHALLIGNSAYTKGWQRLESIPGELAALKAVLVEQGFVVEEVMNSKGKGLGRAVEDFIDQHGYDPANRLLIYFAGHGFTFNFEEQAYLVPMDAPQPRNDEPGFKAKSLSMIQMTAWARQMDAKHALFLFDSCFSGGIFKVRSDPEPPPHITANLMRPVRQFITAGSAREEVPAKSVFAPLLVRALRGEADRNRDGYVTGTELGLYLREGVLALGNAQTPQFGKIRDPELDEGDFVFKYARPPRLVSSEPLSQMRIEFDRLVQADKTDGKGRQDQDSWGAFIANFHQDDPATEEDDRMRLQAEARRRRRQEETLVAEVNMRPTPDLGDLSTAHSEMLDSRPVTRGDYEWCVLTDSCQPLLSSPHCVLVPRASADEPAVCITLEQAAVFCQHVNGRLPRKEDWERLAASAQGRISSDLREWLAPQSDEKSLRATDDSDRRETIHWQRGQILTITSPRESANREIGFRCVRRKP